MQRTIITVGLALTLGCVVVLGVGQAQTVAAQQQTQHADARQQAELSLSRVLPTSPPDVVSTLVDMIGNGTPAAAELACLAFSPTAAAQFATANHTPDCAQAVTQLHHQVTDANAYESNLTLPEGSWTAQGDHAEVNGCAVGWFFTDAPDTSPPGPRPGRMTLQRLDGHGWLITDYRSC